MKGCSLTKKGAEKRRKEKNINGVDLPVGIAYMLNSA